MEGRIGHSNKFKLDDPLHERMPSLPSLTEIDLSACGLGAAAAAVLAEGLGTKYCALRVLRLGQNQLTHRSPLQTSIARGVSERYSDGEGMDALAAALGRNQSLTLLDLSWNSIRYRSTARCTRRH
jgi:hypothetical protein